MAPGGERETLLQRVMAELARAITIESVGDAAIEHGVRALGAVSGAVFLTDERGEELRLFRSAGYSEEARLRFARIAIDPSVPIGDCVLRRVPIYLDSREDYARRYPASEAQGRDVAQTDWLGAACLPLVAGGTARGALSFAFADDRILDPDERGVLEAVASHCAQALDRARLYRESEDARRRAEEAHREIAALHRLSESAARAPTVGALYDSVLGAIRDELGVDRASILLWDAEDRMRFVAWTGLSDAYRRKVDGHSPWTRADRAPQAIWVEDVETDASMAAYLPVFRAEGIRSLAFVPLIHEGELIGKFMLYAREPRVFGERDRRVARVFAEQIAASVTRRRADQRAEDAERRYRSLLEALSSVVWSTGAAGELVAPQDAWERYTGQPWERHRGMGWTEMIHPDDVERVRRLWDTSLASRTPYHATSRVWNAGTSTHRWVEARAVPMLDAGGEVREWIATFLDVHDRRVAEEQREAALHRLSAVLDAAPVLIALIDADQRYQVVNHTFEEWFGAPREAYIGRTVREMLGDEVYARMADHIAAALSGKRVEFEVEMPYARGGARHIRATYVPVREGGTTGRVTGWVSLVLDVTELKKTAAFSELFAGMLAHDLRNPLGAITASSQFLRRVAAEPAAPIARIISSAERMSRMIDQLLDMTRLRLGGGLDLRRNKVNLSAIARVAIDELEAARPDVAIQFSSTGDARGRWDQDRLTQMIGNLVTNAVEHRSGGDVRVRVDGSARDTVTLTVHNAGVITAEVLPHVFAPFRQGVPRFKASGLGLGLYITREVVQAHGGTVEVASAADTGTRFTVTLPRAPGGAS